MTRIILILLFTSFSSYNLYSQVPENATKLYNYGVSSFQTSDYVRADSLFTEALKIYTWPDAYYNKAMSAFRLNDMKSFCLNLKYASDLGDKQSKLKYNSQCTTTDTVYRNSDSLVCDESSAAFFEITSVHPFTYQLDYTQYVNDSVKISYHVDKRDTTYSCLPDMDMPVFPGGELALIKYLSKNITYPTYARSNGISGNVYITFVVDNYGKVVDVCILRGLSSDINNEAIRVVKNMPDWSPGKCNGRTLRTQFNLPMRFTLK